MTAKLCPVKGKKAADAPASETQTSETQTLETASETQTLETASETVVAIATLADAARILVAAGPEALVGALDAAGADFDATIKAIDALCDARLAQLVTDRDTRNAARGVHSAMAVN